MVLMKMIKGNPVVTRIAPTSANKNYFLPYIIYRNIYRIGLWSPSLMWIQAVTHVLTALFCLSCILQTINLLKSLSDLKAAIECFSILSFCGMGLFKLAAMTYNMKHLKLIMKLAKKVYERQRIVENRVTDYESEDERQNETDDDASDDDDDVEMLSKEMNLIATCIPKLYSTTGIVFVMAPFLEYVILTLSGQQVKLPHVLPTWSPYDNSYYAYLAVVLIELSSSIFCVGVHIAFDVICICAMIFVSGQYSLLQLKVNKIGGRAKNCLHSERRDTRTHERIKACHKHHRDLIKVCRSLDAALRPVMGLYFTLATLTLCATAVQFSAKSSKLQFLTMMQYLGATLTQLYLFCRYGDCVYQKSNIRVVQVSWWAMKPRARRELLILGYGFQKAQALRAGWFYTINLESFLSIVQTAYRFYALLNKVKE